MPSEASVLRLQLLSERNYVTVLERALSIRGWMSQEELEWLASLASQSHIGIEIGSWCGRSTLMLSEHIQCRLYAVDHFNGDPGIPERVEGDQLYSEFMRNTMHLQESGKLIALRCHSSIGADVLKDTHPDFVFIDSDHSPESVSKAIELYRPLIRNGGTLCGHDYLHHRMADTLASNGIAKPDVIGTIWSTKI